MKRLVVCCDGTWNRRDAEKPTNVVHTMFATAASDRADVAQVPFYVPGVGVESNASTAIGRWFDRLRGGAFGRGLEANIVDGYRKLVRAYEPGDAIYLIGFSRGAFTARSLAGLIRNCGIPERQHIDKVEEAFALYRSRKPEDHPDSEASRRFRLDYSRHVYLNEEELRWRKEQADDAASAEGHRGAGKPTRLRLAYVGVWDTVGALGIPAGLIFWRWSQKRHQFHDTNLSSCVEAARHAVAIDEERRFYPSALWSNLDRLNCDDRGRKPAEPFRQLWFPGDHSSIGGGGPHDGLEAIAFGWIAEGAAAAGLTLTPEFVAKREKLEDHTVSVLSRGKRPFPIYFRKARKGPTRMEDIAEPTVRRWRDVKSWRPKSLTRLTAALDQAADETA